MKLSVPSIALAAKQHEIDELKQLQAKSRLVGVTGLLIHVLQKERGASGVFLASGGKRFRQKRLDLIEESESVESLLRKSIQAELENASYSNARILSAMAWVILGLDTLPELRKRIGKHRLAGSDSVAAFSRLIAGLISLVFEVADAAGDPEVSQLLVALFNLVQGKEMAGQERAVGALSFGAGVFSGPLQQRIVHLVDAQESNLAGFLEFAGSEIADTWREMQTKPVVRELERLRQMLIDASPGTVLDPNLSATWFDCSSERIADMWLLQSALVDALQNRSAALIRDAERDLQDSEGLIDALRDNPPDGAELADPFFDPALPFEQSVSFVPPVGELKHPTHSVIELLQTQSERLAKMENELSATRKALNERKIIERAKGILMARFKLTEEEASQNLSKASEDRGRSLVEVAESLLSLAF